MSKEKTIQEMSSAELKIAHYDQKIQLNLQHQIVDKMNQNLRLIEESISIAIEKEAAAAKAAEPKTGAAQKQKSKSNSAAAHA